AHDPRRLAMSDRLILCGIALVLLKPVAGQEVGISPASEPPFRFLTLQNVEPKHEVIHQLPYQYVVMKQHQERKVVVTNNGTRTVEYTVGEPIQKSGWKQWTLKDYWVLDHRGDPVRRKKLWDRLRNGTVVLLWSTPDVDPAYLRLLSKEAIIIA